MCPLRTVRSKGPRAHSLPATAQANHADQSIQLKVLQVLPLLLGRLEYPVDAKFIHDSVDTLLLMRRSHSGPVMQQTASATLHQVRTETSLKRRASPCHGPGQLHLGRGVASTSNVLPFASCRSWG